LIISIIAKAGINFSKIRSHIFISIKYQSHRNYAISSYHFMRVTVINAIQKFKLNLKLEILELKVYSL